MEQWNGWNVCRRLFQVVLLVLCVSFFSFVLMEIAPIDPVQSFVRSMGRGVSVEQRAMLVEQWGLNGSFLVRYMSWLKNVLHGDFGMSLVYQREVSKVIVEGFSSSFVMMLIAFVLQGVVGVYFGIVSGVYEGSRVDRFVQGYCMVMSSTPSFWVAMVLIMVFGISLQWVPVGFSSPIGVVQADVGLLDRMAHMVLPITTLVLVGVSEITMHTREKVIEIMHSDYIVYAKSRGLKGMDLITKYGLKNVLLPSITIQFASFAELFSGVVLIETAFNYPGLGGIAVKAGLSGDVPLLLGITVCTAVFVYVGNMLADVLQGVFDVRVRKGVSV